MAGLFPGSGIGASLDKLCAARTQQAALETGTSVVPLRWRNRNTGNVGAITPTRTDRSAAGIYCREYQLTVTASGRTGQAHGSACRLSVPFIPSIAETLEFCITTGYPFRHA